MWKTYAVAPNFISSRRRTWRGIFRTAARQIVSSRMSEKQEGADPLHAANASATAHLRTGWVNFKKLGFEN